jgi:putative SOS response-associated peptidase YedK
MMCVNYTPTRKELLTEKFATPLKTDIEWKAEVWQDYAAPFILHDRHGERAALVGAYSMIPKVKLPPGAKRYSTMNARAETLAQLRSYAKPWHEGQRCLVPMQAFFEPNYENGKAERWKIGLINESDFAVAGIYQSWPEADNALSYSFTQITINADQHPLMRRFHKPGDEKRTLVILHKSDFDDWLSCKNPEMARAYLQLYPTELMRAEPALSPPAAKVKNIEKPQASLW